MMERTRSFKTEVGGHLYLVPTPIGNLDDMTFRAVKILKAADLIAAEDTRNTQKLLNHFEITTKQISFHEHNTQERIPQLVAKLQQGMDMAQVSDAGMPSISDPGFLVVRACVEADIKVECLPGATAFVPALVASGIPSDRFSFEGFLPQKKGRQTRLTALATETRTLIMYESPFRLAKSLGQFAEYFGADRRASVSRELSKMFEETKRGTLSELALYFTEHPPKGEIVIVIAGFEE